MLRARLLAVLVAAAAALMITASVASAHVVPSSTIQLDVGATSISAVVSIPVADVESSTGIDLDDQSQAAVDAEAPAITSYLLAHFTPTTDGGDPWSVAVGTLTVSTTGTAGTGQYQQVTTTFTLTPPTGASLRSFNLGYDAVVEKVATHSVIVTVRSDTDSDTAAYAVGTVRRDTVTNTVEALHVDLASGSEYHGFTGMVRLGMDHIAEGTDHQLFLLTILLPTPLLARGRRWAATVPGRSAAARIGRVTLAFTLGHSITLALGALGLPVPTGTVEALIAVSILVAAAHAIRPIFPGREALVAAGFGLVHGLAFSEALRELDLSGRELVLSLLGFNLGIEAMQLVVVALVLPPLVVLARSGRYRVLRLTAAIGTAVAALGWLADRLGHPNPVAELADQLGVAAIPLVVALWAAVITVATVSHPADAERRAPRDRARGERSDDHDVSRRTADAQPV